MQNLSNSQLKVYLSSFRKNALLWFIFRRHYLLLLCAIYQPPLPFLLINFAHHRHPRQKRARSFSGGSVTNVANLHDTAFRERQLSLAPSHFSKSLLRSHHQTPFKFFYFLMAKDRSQVWSGKKKNSVIPELHLKTNY